jgi:hypothetical protein
MNKALMSIFTSLWLFFATGFAQLRELVRSKNSVFRLKTAILVRALANF